MLRYAPLNFLVVTTLLGSIVSAADTPAVTKPRPVYLPAPSPAAVQILEKFSERTELALAETPLADALAFLQERHQINIWLDQRALQNEGIDPSSPISLELSGVTLRSALRLMLEPLALTTIVEDEVLKVTTRANAKEKIVTRIYPVGDLIEGQEDLGALQSAIHTATTGWRTEYVAPPGHYYAPSPAVTSPPSPMSPPGTMSVVPRSASLVIKQSYAVHEEIVELLTNLRAAQALWTTNPPYGR
jgi:hypothetical protein